MFKVGDKVIVYNSGEYYGITKDDSIGIISFILSNLETGVKFIKVTARDYDYNTLPVYIIHTKHLKLYNPKPKPQSETDFLDAFQQNFKDGV